MSQFKINQQDDGMPDFEELQRLGDEAERKEKEFFIPQKEEKNSRRLNLIHIPEDVFWWLSEESNNRGWSKEFFASWCIIEMRHVIAGGGEPKDNLTRRVKAEIISSQYAEAYHIASIYKDTPNEEIERLLTDACDDIGLTPKELLDRVKSDPFPEYAQRYDLRNDTKTKRCTRFIASLFQDRDEIPSEEMNERAVLAGFNKAMVQEARKRLGIKPVQRDDGWVCVRGKSSKILMSS